MEGSKEESVPDGVVELRKPLLKVERYFVQVIDRQVGSLIDGGWIIFHKSLEELGRVAVLRSEPKAVVCERQLQVRFHGHDSSGLR